MDATYIPKNYTSAAHLSDKDIFRIYVGGGQTKVVNADKYHIIRAVIYNIVGSNRYLVITALVFSMFP